MATCSCPAVTQAAGIAVVMFLFTVLLTLLTVFTTFTEDHEARADEQPGAGDVLQVRAARLSHMQAQRRASH